MTLDQLRIFIAVAERGHMTRAAKLLGMTQSAVSAAIVSLENRYGARLFNRVGRGIELTETGQRFLPEAKAVLDRVSVARSVLQDLSAKIQGSLTIAASQTIASHWLPRRLTSFHAEYPDIRLNVSIGNTRRVETAVAEGLADIGFVEGATSHKALIRTPLDTDRLMLVMPPSHPEPVMLARGRPDLMSMSWVIREAGSGTREVLEDLARESGIEFSRLQISLVLPSNEAVREAVEAGAGCTIISEHVVSQSIAAGHLKAVEADLPGRDFALVRHRDRYQTLAQRALIALLAGRRRIETKKSARARAGA